MLKGLSRWYKKLKDALTHSSEQIVIGLVGWSGAIFVGALFAGSSILNWQSPAFQYLLFGGGTSALFVAWRERGLLESTTFALAFALYVAIPARDLFFPVFIDAALFLLFACVSFHFTWTLIGLRLSFGKFLILGLFFALFELVRTTLFFYELPQSELLRAAVINATLRGTLGLGVGAGIEIAEFILHSFLQHQQRHHHHLSGRHRRLPR